MRLRAEAATIRTGRATPALVENVEVEYYGIKTALKALAAISAPEARQLIIQPWDRAALQAIEKAIINSSLGAAPIVDRDLIRLSIPSLTEERRAEFIKLLGKYAEEARIQVRRARDEALKEIERRYKAKEMGEDVRFREKAEAQKIVDETNQEIAAIEAAKEKELRGV